MECRYGRQVFGKCTKEVYSDGLCVKHYDDYISILHSCIKESVEDNDMIHAIESCTILRSMQLKTSYARKAKRQEILDFALSEHKTDNMFESLLSPHYLGSDVFNYILNYLSGNDLMILRFVIRLPIERCVNSDNSKLFADMIKYGRISLLDWLNDKTQTMQGRFDNDLIAKRALKRGGIRLIKWLANAGYIWSQGRCAYAASYTRIDIMDWFKDNEYPILSDEAAGWAGWQDTTALEWMDKHNGVPNSDWPFVCAVQNNNIKGLRWLFVKYPHIPTITRLYKSAARHGALECIKWMRSSGAVWDADVCRKAREYEHYDILAWIEATGHDPCNGKYHQT